MYLINPKTNNDFPIKSFIKTNWDITQKVQRIGSKNKNLNRVYISKIMNQDVLIKVHDTHAEKINHLRLQKLAQLADLLKENKLLIPKPLLFKNKYFFSYNGKVPIVVYSFVKGDIDGKNYTDMAHAARVLGKFHKICQHINLTGKEKYKLPYPDLLEKINKLKYKFPKNIFNLISKTIDLNSQFLQDNQCELYRLSTGLVHGDFSFKHVLKRKEYSGIIDWEYFDSGFLIQDVDRLIDDYREDRRFNPNKIKDTVLKNYTTYVSLNDHDLSFLDKSESFRDLYRSLGICEKILITENKKNLSMFLNATINKINI